MQIVLVTLMLLFLTMAVLLQNLMALCSDRLASESAKLLGNAPVLW